MAPASEVTIAAVKAHVAEVLKPVEGDCQAVCLPTTRTPNGNASSMTNSLSGCHVTFFVETAPIWVLSAVDP